MCGVVSPLVNYCCVLKCKCTGEGEEVVAAAAARCNRLFLGFVCVFVCVCQSVAGRRDRSKSPEIICPCFILVWFGLVCLHVMVVGDVGMFLFFFGKQKPFCRPSLLLLLLLLLGD